MGYFENEYKLKIQKALQKPTSSQQSLHRKNLRLSKITSRENHNQKNQENMKPHILRHFVHFMPLISIYYTHSDDFAGFP